MINVFLVIFQWDLFSILELDNFLTMLTREEDHEVSDSGQVQAIQFSTGVSPTCEWSRW